jgi:DoxX
VGTDFTTVFPPIRRRRWRFLRIVVAVLFIEAGSVLLFNIPPTVHPQSPSEMETLPLIAGILELMGGFLILVGFLTRPVAFVLSGMMAVAYSGFHAPMNPCPSNNLGRPRSSSASSSSTSSSPGPAPGAWTTRNGAGSPPALRRRNLCHG